VRGIAFGLKRGALGEHSLSAMKEDRTKSAAKPAAEQEAREPVKHPPRPVKGPADVESAYERISRRFDKVLARLAEKE
jgi:hypothetical protein